MSEEDRLSGTSLGDVAERYGSMIKLVDELHCGLAIGDGRGTNLFVNRRLAEWMRSEPEELLGDTHRWLTPEQVAELGRERDMIFAGDLRARLVVLRRSDGTTFPVLALPHVLGGFEDPVGIAWLMIELSTVQTARQFGSIEPERDDDQVLSMLQSIAMQLRQLVAAVPAGPPRVDLRHPGLRGISPRELEVLDLLLQGERVASIAEQLYISDHTVRNHLKSMYRKTGTGSQAALVQWARSLA